MIKHIIKRLLVHISATCVLGLLIAQSGSAHAQSAHRNLSHAHEGAFRHLIHAQRRIDHAAEDHITTVAKTEELLGKLDFSKSTIHDHTGAALSHPADPVEAMLQTDNSLSQPIDLPFGGKSEDIRCAGGLCMKTLPEGVLVEHDGTHAGPWLSTNDGKEISKPDTARLFVPFTTSEPVASAPRSAGEQPSQLTREAAASLLRGGNRGQKTDSASTSASHISHSTSTPIPITSDHDRRVVATRIIDPVKTDRYKTVIDEKYHVEAIVEELDGFLREQLRRTQSGETLAAAESVLGVLLNHADQLKKELAGANATIARGEKSADQIDPIVEERPQPAPPVIDLSNLGQIDEIIQQFTEDLHYAAVDPAIRAASNIEATAGVMTEQFMESIPSYQNCRTIIEAIEKLVADNNLSDSIKIDTSPK